MIAFFHAIDFAVGDEVFHFSLQVSRDHFYGPLQFPDFGPTYPSLTGTGDTLPAVQLHAGLAGWSSTGGKFSVAADHHSGTVDMDLGENVIADGYGRRTPNGGQAVHVSGSWRCAT